MINLDLRNEIFRQLSYMPDRGVFIWLKDGERGRHRYRAGKIVDEIKHPMGYRQISFSAGYNPALSHRLAFVFMTRDWPKGVVDHINGDKTDNRWENLRDTDMVVNSRNSTEQRVGNASGLRGVH